MPSSVLQVALVRCCARVRHAHRRCVLARAVCRRYVLWLAPRWFVNARWLSDGGAGVCCSVSQGVWCTCGCYRCAEDRVCEQWRRKGGRDGDAASCQPRDACPCAARSAGGRSRRGPEEACSCRCGCTGDDEADGDDGQGRAAGCERWQEGRRIEGELGGRPRSPRKGGGAAPLLRQCIAFAVRRRRVGLLR